MSRKISFCLLSNVNDNEWKNSKSFNFTQYCVLLYYSSQLNSTSGNNLSNASMTKFEYNYDNNLSTFNQSDTEGYANLIQLQQAISFLNTQVISSLQNQPTEKDIIIDEYGGIDSFITGFYSVTYLKSFGINEEDIEVDYTGYIPNLLRIAVELSDFFQTVVDNNNSYEILVH